MKKIRFVCIVLCIFVAIFCPAANAAESVPQSNNAEEETLPASSAYGCSGLDGKMPIMGNQQIIPNMTAAFLYDVDEDVVLYALNADMPIYPASLVKIMTAIIAVEKGNLSDEITVKEHVLSTVPRDATNVNLQPNEVISLENALYCMMVGSGNDAAAVIADHVCGSQEAFVQEMNRLAAELGCSGTYFTNPHGLYQQNQVSTVRDVARIIQYAMENPSFMTFFAEAYYEVPQTNKYAARSLYSNNYLMYSVDNMRIYRDYRTTGGRTGIDDMGRRCVAATAEDDGRTLISVVYGAESKYDEEEKKTIIFGGFTETSDLLTMGFDNYEPRQVLHEGQIFKQYAVINGENDVVVGSAESAFSVLPISVSASDLSYKFFDEKDAFTAPIVKGQKLSHVQIWYGNVCLAQTDLYAMSDVRALSPEQLEEPKQDNAGAAKDVLLVIALIAAGAVIMLVVLRLIGALRNAAIRRRSRRYRKNRRRSR